MLSIVLQKLLANARHVERLKVARAESIQWTSFAGKFCFFNLELASALIRQISSKFTINCVHFPVCGTLCEKRSLKELAEYVKCIIEDLIFDIEVVVCVVFTSCRIFHTTVRLDKLAVVVLFRELLGAQEEHMFTKVRQTIEACRVVQAARVDMEGGRSFLSLLVLNKQTLQLVRKLDEPVVSLVARALAQRV